MSKRGMVWIGAIAFSLAVHAAIYVTVIKPLIQHVWGL